MNLKMNDRLIRRLLLTYSLTFILISIADASAMLADELVAVVLGGGIEGIGIVTGISWDIAVIVLVLNFFKKNSIFRFKPQKIDFRSIGKIIVTGSPRISRYLCKILSKLFTNRIILLYGGSISVSALSVNALCLEEIAGNIVEHGFKLDRKPHYCDIRILIEQDHTICLRIRDDCKLFDMQEIYKALKKEDIAANVGIKIVYGMARDVSYFSLLKTNNVIIHI